MEERDRRRWDLADENKDSRLTKEEFSRFLHPEEAEHMRDIVVQETLEDIDKARLQYSPIRLMDLRIKVQFGHWFRL